MPQPSPAPLCFPPLALVPLSSARTKRQAGTGRPAAASLCSQAAAQAAACHHQSTPRRCPAPPSTRCRTRARRLAGSGPWPRGNALLFLQAAGGWRSSAQVAPAPVTQASIAWQIAEQVAEQGPAMSRTGLIGPLQDAWRLWNVSTNPVLHLNDLPPRSEKRKPLSEAGLLKKIGKESCSAPGSFTGEEVARHNTTDDCWIVVKDKVYDITEFLPLHPGGPVIFTQAGRDATDTFSSFHAPSTWKLLQNFYIGELVNNEPLSELLKDFRELRALFLRNQFFKSSKLWYTWKMLSTLAILGVSIAIIGLWSSLPAVLVSAFILALFWQQCGWMAHDFLHHQVFEGRWWNTVIGGFCWGNFLQGFSVGWWKTKHNVHHAAPNQCDDHYQPVDPDIDTLPLVAWSKDILETVDSHLFRSVIRRQHLLFVPLLFFARFSWLQSSWAHTNIANLSLQQKAMEKITICLHYLFFGGLGLWFLPPGMAVTWFLTAQLFCGLLLSGVFVISHNGMEVYNDSKDFVSAQIASTRDIQASMFNDWFTGGLNRQIEHHLFPSLPRHNLTKASPYVKALCAKHGLKYEDVSLMTGTHRVFDRLAKVAAAA